MSNALLATRFFHDECRGRDGEHLPNRGRILAGDGHGDVPEDVALDQDLGAHAGVDGGVHVLVEGIKDVHRAETDGGPAGVAVLPVVVGVGDAEMARVVAACLVAVAY